MKVEINGSFRDIVSFIVHIKKRKRIFKRAKASPVAPGRMNMLAEELHPLSQRLIVDSVITETADANTYRLKGAGRRPAFFIPGQYISISLQIGGSTLARPFSISSMPQQTIDAGYYDITVKNSDDEGFTGRWIMENWKTGTEVMSSGPAGSFTWQKLRDCSSLVCIAGGSGITPFKPIISSLLSSNRFSRVILFYGARNSNDLIFKDFWEDTVKKHAGRFFHIPVLSEPDNGWQGEKGFITAELITRTIKSVPGGFTADECSYFICGPEGLHSFIDKELSGLDISGKRIRREEYAVNTRSSGVGSPSGKRIVSLTVRQGDSNLEIKADPDETVLVALERAGLDPPSLCRTGECGWCRSRLVSGKISGNKKPGRRSGLRMADEKFGYFHPCSAFPESDLVIEIPPNPVKNLRSSL